MFYQKYLLLFCTTLIYFVHKIRKNNSVMAAARFEQLKEGGEIRSLFITRTDTLGQPERQFKHPEGLLKTLPGWQHLAKIFVKWSALELLKKKNSTVQIHVLSHMNIKTTEIGLYGKVLPKITTKIRQQITVRACWPAFHVSTQTAQSSSESFLVLGSWVVFSPSTIYRGKEDCIGAFVSSGHESISTIIP